MDVHCLICFILLVWWITRPSLEHFNSKQVRKRASAFLRTYDLNCFFTCHTGDKNENIKVCAEWDSDGSWRALKYYPLTLRPVGETLAAQHPTAERTLNFRALSFFSITHQSHLSDILSWICPRAYTAGCWWSTCSDCAEKHVHGTMR